MSGGTANFCFRSPVTRPTDCRWGQDRLVPIFLATLAIKQQSRVIRFRSAAQMLDAFGMQQGGTQYRRSWVHFSASLARRFSSAQQMSSASAPR
jgi:hypothetical protein